MIQWRFSSSSTSGVSILDLHDFQFSSVGKFQFGGLWEERSQLAGFIYNNRVWSSVPNCIVGLNVKVPENFKRLVFCTRYRFVIILFLGNIKAFLSTYTPLHSLFHPVMLSFVFFLKKFRTLRNNVSYCFIVLSLFYCFLLYYFSVLLLYHYHYYYYYYYFIIFISLGLSMNFSWISSVSKTL